MDNTGTYIKMSDCPEIQEQRPQALIGLIKHYYRGEYQYEVDSDGDFWRYKRHFIWLPRQDQLQEMVKDTFPLSNALIHWFEQWFVLHWLRDSSLSEWSMEQLWLAFVMKEKYNKVWDGNTWTSG